MTLFDSPAFEGHEEVLSFYDAPTGLKVIIAIHSTARGPSAGGCRMWNYASAEAALEDALKLSRAMSYKNAMADLELGGEQRRRLCRAGVTGPLKTWASLRTTSPTVARRRPTSPAWRGIPRRPEIPVP